MANNMIVVGMADLNITKSPGVLTTLGLGSCVGVALYDTVNKIAGLAHIMLPDSKQFQNHVIVAKFADTALTKLVGDMVKAGALRGSIKAKIAGGAQMFAFNSTNESMRIGDRNVESVIMNLKIMQIPLIAQDTGSNYGRTVELYSQDGSYFVKTIGRGNKFI